MRKAGAGPAGMASGRLNMLVDALPRQVEIGGVGVDIRTDFRIGVLFEQLVWDKALDARTRVWQAVRLYYPQRVDDVEEAYRKAVWFWHGGEFLVEEGGLNRRQVERNALHGGGRRLYDFDVDGALVYAAFLDQYGVDLQDARGLHWWKFRAMFEGLRPDHAFCRRMAVRAMDLSQVRDGAERARLAAMKARWRLDGDRGTMEEKAGVVFL